MLNSSSNPFFGASLPGWQRPSDTIPALSLEVAAQEEWFLLRRDAKMACCFGLSVSHLTALRQSPEPAKRLHWEMLEWRWLTEGPAIHAATQKRQAARAQRLRLQAAEDADYRHLAVQETQKGQEAQKVQENGDPPLHWFLRATLLLLDFSARLLETLSSGRVILPVAGCFLGCLLLGALIPSFWESIFTEAKSFLTGVTP